MMADLRSEMAGHLAGFERIPADRPDLKSSAVALCVVDEPGGPSLLITRRASRMRSHAGQLALPGGRLDAGESTADAARRELFEETGLSVDPDAVLPAEHDGAPDGLGDGPEARKSPRPVGRGRAYGPGTAHDW